MWLTEDAVDLLDIDGAGLIADRFDEGREGDISGSAQNTLGGTDDKGHGVLGEDVVADSGAIKLVEEKGFDLFRGQRFENDRIGHPRSYFLVDVEREGLHQMRLTD